MAAAHIRAFNNEDDFDQVGKCLIELQDFERQIDPRMPAGADIVDQYVPQMLVRCQACNGQVLVATVEDEVAGYVTVLSRVKGDDIGDGETEFGLIADLVVRATYRRMGIGQQLLDAAETFARAKGVNWLRIGSLASNQIARELYTARGYTDLYVELEKDLTADR